jgi:hypothetical protein
MKITAEPRSDQWNADDFVGGPRTFTIAGVSVGKAEQKYDIQLVDSDRAWRPPLTVLRLLIAAWGDDATTWVGHKVTLYRDESVHFGRDAVGGIRVSHLSHINGPLTVNLTASRGKRAKLTVQPLIEAPAPDYTTHIAAATTKDDLNTLWQNASAAGHLTEDLKAAFIARAGELGEN